VHVPRGYLRTAARRGRPKGRACFMTNSIRAERAVMRREATQGPLKNFSRPQRREDEIPGDVQIEEGRCGRETAES
jgi:hypothetical protein